MKIEFTSYISYCPKLSQQSIFFTKLNSLVVQIIVSNWINKKSSFVIHNPNAIKFSNCRRNWIIIKFTTSILLILTNLPLNLLTIFNHLLIFLLLSFDLLPKQYLKYHWNQPWGIISLMQHLFSQNLNDVPYLTPYLLTLQS